MGNRCRIIMIEQQEQDEILILKGFYSHNSGDWSYVEPSLSIAKNIKPDFYNFYKMYDKIYGADFYFEEKCSIYNFNFDYIVENFKIGDNGIYLINKNYELIYKVNTNSLDLINNDDDFIKKATSFLNKNNIKLDIKLVLNHKINHINNDAIIYRILDQMIKCRFIKNSAKKIIKQALQEELNNKIFYGKFSNNPNDIHIIYNFSDLNENYITLKEYENRILFEYMSINNFLKFIL